MPSYDQPTQLQFDVKQDVHARLRHAFCSADYASSDGRSRSGSDAKDEVRWRQDIYHDNCMMPGNVNIPGRVTEGEVRWHQDVCEDDSIMPGSVVIVYLRGSGVLAFEAIDPGVRRLW